MNSQLTAVPLVIVSLSIIFAFPLVHAAGLRTPEATVDAFHEGLRNGDAALALSVLTRDVTVYEMGVIDQSRTAYASAHLQADMKEASSFEQEVLSRRSGGTGDQRWVLSAYRLKNNERVRTMLETAVLRRVGDTWRIAHIHWSYTFE